MKILENMLGTKMVKEETFLEEVLNSASQNIREDIHSYALTADHCISYEEQTYIQIKIVMKNVFEEIEKNLSHYVELYGVEVLDDQVYQSLEDEIVMEFEVSDKEKRNKEILYAANSIIESWPKWKKAYITSEPNEFCQDLESEKAKSGFLGMCKKDREEVLKYALEKSKDFLEGKEE